MSKKGVPSQEKEVTYKVKLFEIIGDDSYCESCDTSTHATLLEDSTGWHEVTATQLNDLRHYIDYVLTPKRVKARWGHINDYSAVRKLMLIVDHKDNIDPSTGRTLHAATVESILEDAKALAAEEKKKEAIAKKRKATLAAKKEQKEREQLEKLQEKYKK